MKITATVALAAALALIDARAADPVPLLDFFKQPAYTSAVLSPDGKYVALAAKGAKGGKGLVVFDLEDPSKSKALARFADADVGRILWVGNKRLVFWATDAQTDYGNQVGQGVFTVAKDGGEAVPLTPRFDQTFEGATTIDSVAADGSGDLLLIRFTWDHRGEPRGSAIGRLNAETNQFLETSYGAPDYVRRWAFDRKGNARVAVASFEGRTRVFWRTTADADAPWKKVLEAKAIPGDDRFIPLAVDSTNTLYLTRREENEDTRSLWRLDLSAADPRPVSLLSLKGYDFVGGLVMNGEGRVVGIRYLTDARGTYWFDTKLKAIQEKVDAMLPGMINQVDCGNCDDPAVVLVRSWSDRQPAVYRIYDTRKATMKVIAESRPWIDPKRMAHQEMTRVPARDGLEIPVHVTRPAGATGPSPMVVLVHGGPNLRGGEWQWDAEAQFLASRGYVVLEPEFRGSTGFGLKHFKAGWKQWGLAMQDDVADATQWAIQKGIADPKRICIAGASYGGYATLMGLARDPQLYRCGIDWIGVTDLDLMYSSRWSDMTDAAREYGMPLLMGDRERDAKQLAETSPVNVASRIKQPVLMAYGDSDRRVPIQHGARMRDALAPYNKNVEWVVYADEGHGWWLESTKVDFWTRVERFLEKNAR